MKQVTSEDLKELYIPPPDSHKGQNGRLLIIGGSHLFHAASLWALKVASRIVDLVHYSSVEENNELVIRLKSEFRDGIVIPRSDVENYIEEDDVILIGPGMVRSEFPNAKFPASPARLAEAPAKRAGRQIPNKFQIQNLKELENITDEGILTAVLTNYLLKKYPHKQWVIDAGALQMVDVNLIPKNAILTPHLGEFELVWSKADSLQLIAHSSELNLQQKIQLFAKRYQCSVLVKGQIDIACNGGVSGGMICAPGECVEIKGGNAGMTKGGTGDVLAGLIAALATKNEPFLSTIAGAFINKQAGDSLYKRVGPFFNASDLAGEIPKVMKKLLT